MLWYVAAVKWAVDSKLVYENDKEFNPDSEISRQQIASVLYLYAKLKEYDVSTEERTNILSYDDASDIYEYAIPAMQYVKDLGIIAGKTESTLNPKDRTTRAEIAVILHRFIEKTTLEKVMDIISGIAFCVWLILEALERANKIQSAGFFACIAIVIICICEAFPLWNVKRSLSYVAIVGTVIMLTVVVLAAIYKVQL